MDGYRKCSKCGISASGKDFFHRFPKPGKTNVLRVRAWAKYCWPEKDWLSVKDLTKLFTNNKVLCKEHFEDSCFTDSTRKRLSKFSVPGEKEYVSNLMTTLRKEISITQYENEQLDEHMPLQYSKQIPSTSKEPVTCASANIDLPQSKTDKCSDNASASPHTSEKPAKPFNTASASSQISEKPAKSSDTASLQKSEKPIKFSLVTPQTSEESTLDIAKLQTKDTEQIKKIDKAILGALNLKTISQLTEREEKLYRICAWSFKEIARLRKCLRRKKKSNRVHSMCDSDSE